MTRSLLDNFCGKTALKSFKYSQNYEDGLYQLVILENRGSYLVGYLVGE